MSCLLSITRCLLKCTAIRNSTKDHPPKVTEAPFLSGIRRFEMTLSDRWWWCSWGVWRHGLQIWMIWVLLLVNSECIHALYSPHIHLLFAYGWSLLHSLHLKWGRFTAVVNENVNCWKSSSFCIIFCHSPFCVIQSLCHSLCFLYSLKLEEIHRRGSLLYKPSSFPNISLSLVQHLPRSIQWIELIYDSERLTNAMSVSWEMMSAASNLRL